MKKAYLVTYNSSNGNNKNIVREQLQLMGAIQVVSDSARSASWLVIPTDESMSASTIRAEVFKHLAPFSDQIVVFRVDALDASGSNNTNAVGFVSECKGANEEELRNFNRFSSRHEAFHQYLNEKPRWVYDDGIGMAVRVEFDEWCWLPIKEDGIYKNGKYDKYLR